MEYTYINSAAVSIIEEVETQGIKLVNFKTTEINNALEYVRELATQMYLSIDADEFYSTLAKEIENGKLEEMPNIAKVVDALKITRNFVEPHTTMTKDANGNPTFSYSDVKMAVLHQWYNETLNHLKYALSNEYKEAKENGIRVIC